jgi:hypothetical protein
MRTIRYWSQPLRDQFWSIVVSSPVFQHFNNYSQSTSFLSIPQRDGAKGASRREVLTSFFILEICDTCAHETQCTHMRMLTTGCSYCSRTHPLYRFGLARSRRTRSCFFDHIYQGDPGSHFFLCQAYLRHHQQVPPRHLVSHDVQVCSFNMSVARPGAGSWSLVSKSLIQCRISELDPP